MAPGFQKGNNFAALRKTRGAPTRPNFLTQALISELNEIDPETDKPKFHVLAQRLVALAMGGVFKHKIKEEGKWRTIEVFLPPDLSAIKEVFDRVQGRALQQVDATSSSEGSRVVIHIDSMDDKV